MGHSVANDSVPKIILNDTVNLFLYAAISIFVISNHKSFRVLFDKIASGQSYTKNIFIFYHWKWPAQETSTVSVVSAHFRFIFLRSAAA